MRTEEYSIPQQGHSFSITTFKDTKERKRPDDILKCLLVKMKSDLKQKTRWQKNEEINWVFQKEESKEYRRKSQKSGWESQQYEWKKSQPNEKVNWNF